MHGGGRRFDPGILHLPCRREIAGETSLIFHRILAATDGTEASLRGVEVAAQMVARYQAEFILLTAVSVPQHVVLAANMDERTIEKYVERMAQEALGSAVAAAAPRGRRRGGQGRLWLGPGNHSGGDRDQRGRSGRHGSQEPQRAEGPGAGQRQRPRRPSRQGADPAGPLELPPSAAVPAAPRVLPQRSRPSVLSQRISSALGEQCHFT